MPSYLARFEDTAAILTYVGNWRAGSPVEDSLGNQYSESSFTLTNTTSSIFAFSFYGTEVSVFGAKRGNHGRFQASLDGVASPVASGQAFPERFNATLFTAKTSLGFHNVMITNLGEQYLDIDSVSWLAQVGNDDEPLTIERKEDTDSSFVYNPGDAWSTAPPTLTPSQGSRHATSRSGATAQLTFQGDAIALYGPVGPTGATSYSVTVGCRPPSFYSAWNQNNISQSQLLYYGANLGGGTHTLTLQLGSATDPARILAVDYAEIFTSPSIQNSQPSTDDSCSSSPQSSSNHNTPVGLIVGVAVAGFVALLAIGLLAYLYFLSRRAQFHSSGRPAPPQPSMTHHNIGPSYHATPFVLPPSGNVCSGCAAQSPNTTSSPTIHSQPPPQYHPNHLFDGTNRAASPKASRSSGPLLTRIFGPASSRPVRKCQTPSQGARNGEPNETLPTYTPTSAWD